MPLAALPLLGLSTGYRGARAPLARAAATAALASAVHDTDANSFVSSLTHDGTRNASLLLLLLPKLLLLLLPLPLPLLLLLLPFLPLLLLP
jgi:hypothetical protein